MSRDGRKGREAAPARGGGKKQGKSPEWVSKIQPKVGIQVEERRQTFGGRRKENGLGKEAATRLLSHKKKKGRVEGGDKRSIRPRAAKRKRRKSMEARISDFLIVGENANPYRSR